jgi:hypothetical protein
MVGDCVLVGVDMARIVAATAVATVAERFGVGVAVCVGTASLTASSIVAWIVGVGTRVAVGIEDSHPKATTASNITKVGKCISASIYLSIPTLTHAAYAIPIAIPIAIESMWIRLQHFEVSE